MRAWRLLFGLLLKLLRRGHHRDGIHSEQSLLGSLIADCHAHLHALLATIGRKDVKSGEVHTETAGIGYSVRALVVHNPCLALGEILLERGNGNK